MKCRSCGRESSEATSACPSCGTLFPALPVEAFDAADLDRTPVLPPSRSGGSSADAPTVRRPAGEKATEIWEGTPEVAARRFLPGTVLAGRYRIVGLLGTGAMGEVYRADDLKLDLAVALKFLPEKQERDEERTARFLGEVKIARQVSHPNVCKVFDLGEVDGHLFLSMEHIDGEDLASLLRRIGRLPADKAVEIGRELALGLAAVHAEGILHRDLKPANMMIDGRGRARITDFGIAGLAESIHGAEVAVGTPSYMAPEQLTGEAVSEKSDLFALGLVLYELVTGQRAYDAGSLTQLLHGKETPPALPSSLVEGLDPAVEGVIMSCLAKDARDRPESAEAVAAALGGGREDVTLRTFLASRRRRNLVSLAIALAVAAFVVLLGRLEDVTRLGLLANTEAKQIDLRFRLRGPRPPSGDVVVVAIDSKSIDEIGRWPWPRSIHARLIDRLREWGASAVAFDILFSEPQGEREAQRLRRIQEALEPDAEAARKEVAAALEEVLIDQQVVAAMQRASAADAALTVLAYEPWLPEDMAGNRWPDKVPSLAGEQIVLDVGGFRLDEREISDLRRRPMKLALGISPVITVLAEQSAALGFVNPVRDGDGVVRRHRLIMVYGAGVASAWKEGRDPEEALLDPGQPVRALMPLAVAGVATHLRLPADRRVLDQKNSELRLPAGDGEKTIRFDAEDGTMMVDFYGPRGSIPSYSYVDVLRDELADEQGRHVDGREALRGKLVFVGFSDPGLGDTLPTPFTAALGGVELHATVADNLLQGRQLRRHRHTGQIVVLSALAAALVVALAAANLSALWAALAVSVVAVGWLVVTYRDFASEGLLWNWTVPLTILALGYVLVIAYRQTAEQRARRRLEQHAAGHETAAFG